MAGRRTQRRSLPLAQPPAWFSRPRPRRRRRAERSIWTSRWWWAFLALLAFLWAVSWTFEYLPGLIFTPHRYRLTAVGLATALLAPTVVAALSFLAYRRFTAWRAASVHPSRPQPAPPVAISREPIPAGLRFAVLKRDGFRCSYCGRGEPEGVRLHLDHLVPVAHGGKNELENLATACQDCNLGKGASDFLGTQMAEP